ncbi:hypothetical protein CAPTEDRAFT_194013 [Capitella teleta]|uniref:Uncharacterized protein n=1 Tax=Capitella teleta TaxID=283909 RepID=R7T3E7_CAPTE|nr:hypothetical protein CAPTEDRAFT_194013 [Capitella teleta]|eukprot:ELT87163.1 hypothetical protein CAPTEDRAFT_194013 [Capitella teleta]
MQGQTVEETNADYKCDCSCRKVYVLGFLIFMALGIPITVVVGGVIVAQYFLAIFGVLFIVIGIVIVYVQKRRLAQQAMRAPPPPVYPTDDHVEVDMRPPATVPTMPTAPMPAAMPTVPMDNSMPTTPAASDAFAPPPTYDAVMEATYDPPPDYVATKC